MRKRHFGRIAALCLAVLILFSLCSCADTAGEQGAAVSSGDEEQKPAEVRVFGEYDMTLERLQDNINEQRRKSVSESDIDLMQFLPDYTSPDFIADEFTAEEVDILTAENIKYPQKISYEQAKEDVDVLFRLLRTSYGGYTFFGGDEAFGAAKEEALRRLESGFALGITPSAFRTLLVSTLEFVEDSHLYIGGEAMKFAEHHFYKDKNELTFREDENGFYAVFEEDATKWYLAQEDESWLRLTIADDGELVYRLFAMDEEFMSMSIRTDFMLSDKSGDTMVYNAVWRMMQSKTVSEDGYYERYDEDGIPIVRLSSYSFVDDRREDADAYVNDARALRDKPVIVVDLRGNRGGNLGFSELWLEKLTEVYISSGIGSASYVSLLNERVLDITAGNYYEVFPEEKPDEADYEEWALKQGDLELFTEEQKFYRYSNTIFVLFNKDTSSAAEVALLQFRNMENVVLIGTNSNGCMLITDVNYGCPVSLPNSRLGIYYGMDINVFEGMDDFESVGIIADVIVDDLTAVQDVVDCWNYYNGE